MKGAIIDMGTNTFSLLIYEIVGNGKKQIYRERIFVNLGEGGIHKDVISQEALYRAFHVIQRYIIACDNYLISRQNVLALGTSAIRNAINSDEIIQSIQEKFGINVKIIKGEEEADFIYKGVKEIHPFCRFSSCIMDIGGGSTEFIVTHSSEIIKEESFKMGLSRIIQRFELSNPLSNDDLQKIVNYLDDKTEHFFEGFKIDDFIGTAGSFETVYNLIHQRLDFDRNTTHYLPKEKLNEALNFIIHSTLKERENSPWVIDFRKRMMNVAATMMRWAIEKTKAERCYFSPASLKEGVLADFLEK